MSTVLTSTYGGIDFPINYRTDAIGGEMDASDVYPTDVGPTVLGEIWAPRLFAKGLDTLELGGNGSVAISAEGKRALAIDVTAVAQGGDVAAHDRVDVVFGQPAFRLGAALEVSPDDAVALRGGDMSLSATGPVQFTGDDVSVQATGGLSLTGAAVNVSAVQDVVLSSDGNPTLTIKKDRIIIKGDLEVTGTLNKIGDDTIAMGANFVELGGGREKELTTGGGGSQQGLLINTVPDADGLIVAGELDEYLRKFKDTQGQPVFYTGDVFDSAKYSAANDILYKGLVFNVNKGSAVAGQKTLASRMQEPFWDMTGGAMKVSRVVPDAATDAVIKMSMALRVTDAGELEVVRHKAPYAFTDGQYVEGESDSLQVLARWGHV